MEWVLQLVRIIQKMVYPTRNTNSRCCCQWKSHLYIIYYSMAFVDVKQTIWQRIR
jgi:hypothetical protein